MEGSLFILSAAMRHRRHCVQRTELCCRGPSKGLGLVGDVTGGALYGHRLMLSQMAGGKNTKNTKELQSDQIAQQG